MAQYSPVQLAPVRLAVAYYIGLSHDCADGQEGFKIVIAAM